MPETIAFSGTVAVAAGPKVAFSESLEAEAYNRLSVTVKKAASQKVLLGTADSEIRLLLVRSTKYDPSKVSFQIEGAGAARTLDMPFLMAGKAAVGLLGANTPTFLTFKNDLGEDITVDIIIARDPTP
jgi:hypothetical protein